MELELPNKINNYENPYVALAQSLNDTRNSQGEAFEQLLKFIIKTSTDNINEQIFTVKDQAEFVGSDDIRCNRVSVTNIFEMFSNIQYDNSWDWDTGNPQKVFSALEKAGLDFTVQKTTWFIPENKFDKFSKDVNSKEDFFNKIEQFSIKKELSYPVFATPNGDEDKAICLVGHVYKQMSQEDFEQKIKDNNFLHLAVVLSKHDLIKFLIEDCKINPNLKNADLETPLFYCRNMKTLEVMNKYTLNWFSKDVLGKDCLSSFTALNDKEISKNMVEFSQKRMTETMKDNVEEEVSPEYIKARIKQTLLEMVQADRTKKELEDFIKKNKITSFSDVFDDEGNSLAQICLKKSNWARYEIFKKSYPLDHVNNKGVGSLEILFPLVRASYIDKAKDILDNLIVNKVHEKNGNFSFNLIKDYFNNSRLLDVPNWFFQNDTKGTYLSFAKHFVGEEHARDFSENYVEKKHSGYSYGSDAGTYEEESTRLKAVAYLLLTHASIYSNGIDLAELPISEIFTERKSYYDDNKTEYDVDKIHLYNLLAVLETIDQNAHLNKFDYTKLWDKFEQKAVEHLVKDYHSARSAEEKELPDFIEKNELVMHTLLDRNSELFKAMINDEFIADMAADRGLSIKMGYVLLNSQVKGNTEKTNKTKKI